MPGKNDDGRLDTWLIPILRASFGNDVNTNTTTSPAPRMVSNLTANARIQRKTVMDSGAGRSVFDNDALYAHGSRRKVDAEVVWGDGSTHPVKYEGQVGPLPGCINTGGASDVDLIGVGSTIDALQQKYKRKITVVFDEAASYIFKDVAVTPHPTKRDRYTLNNESTATGMLTAIREEGDTGIYMVPLHDDTPQPIKRARTIQASKAQVAPQSLARTTTGVPVEYPDRQHVKHRSHCPCVHNADDIGLLTKHEKRQAKPESATEISVFDQTIPLQSHNQGNISKELKRLHNCWSHPGQEVMRRMLLLSGTQKHKRLAKKVYELQPLCNECLDGTSQAQPHSRDNQQPTSKATRPLERVCSDCTCKNNIPTLSGAVIAFIIVDQYCKYCWLWMLKSVSQVTGVVKQWLISTIKQKRHLQTDPDRSIMFWRSDNGPDFPKSFTRMLQANGIEHERTGSKASQQNADAETWLNVLQKKCRTSLSFARAPRPWYGEAYMHTCVSLNHICRIANEDNAAPVTIMYGRRPDISKLKPFGCLAFINVPKKDRVGTVNSASHVGVLMGYVTGSDGRILAYRIYDFDTASFKHPYDVTFNVDVPAIPYVASMRQLAPPVRIIHRQVMKMWNGVPYYGEVTGTRVDKDGETLYCVRYNDNDYEEYSFLDIMKYLQPYDPFANENDLVQITPFFGSTKSDLNATDSPNRCAHSDPDATPTASKPTASGGTRKSARVRVVRRIHNVQDEEDDVADIPSSINNTRSRKAYNAKVRAFKAVIRRKRTFIKEMRAEINKRERRACRKTGRLPSKITIQPGTFVDTLPLPSSYEDAITGPYRDYWIKAIAEELENLRSHGVWRLQKLPRDAKPIKGKMVFKWKPTEKNTLHKPKARFTLKGYHQQKHKHYTKTYASVAALMTVFLTCIIAVELDMAMHQTDIKAAYLTAPIEPEIELFMEPPPGMTVAEGMGLRVCKALYGSMQGAARLDVHKDKSMSCAGFIRSCAEPSLYFMPASSPHGLVVVCTVVDDFLIVCGDKHMHSIKAILRTIWTVTDGGVATWFLNLRISRDRRSGVMKIDQSAYAEVKLREFGLDKDPAPKLPMKPATKLRAAMAPVDEAEKAEMEKLPYRAMTGSANYFRMTRPDMSVASSTISQANKAWGRQHVQAAKELLRYAGGSKHWGVGFAKSGIATLIAEWIIEVWVDASHAICPNTRRSRTGFFVTLNGNLLSFKSKLQPGVPAQSSTAAEYRALSDALNEVIWIVMVLKELGIKVRKPIMFREDNEATIKLSENNMASARSKHIDLRHHVIRYHNKQGTICLSYCPTSEMIADMLTKCLALPAFQRLRAAVMTDEDVDVNDDRYQNQH